MVSEGIYMKKVDRAAYRKLKSAAAERGVPVYTLLNEAIAAYVRSKLPKGGGEGAASQDDVDNVAYSIIESDSALAGKWVGIANGKLIGASDTEPGAVELMRRAYARSPFVHGIVGRVGQLGEEREWLAGSIQRE